MPSGLCSSSIPPAAPRRPLCLMTRMTTSTGSRVFAVACGGTGGHIFPGLATARVLRERGHQVLVCLAGKAVEGEAVRAWQGETLLLPAAGLPRRPGPETLRAVFSMLRAGLTARKAFRRS